MKPTRSPAFPSSTLRRARRPVIEEVEPRILYSADLGPGLLDEPTPLEQPEQRLLESSGEFESALAQEVPSQPAIASSDSPASAEQSVAWELEVLLDDQYPASATAEQPTAMQDASVSAPAVETTVASMPLAFERNLGQSDGQVDFLARGSGYAVWLTDGDAVIALRGDDSGHVLRLDVLGADPDAVATGEGLLGGTSNYLVGAQAQWQSDLANYQGVYYDEIYDGIDLRYYGNQRQLEYDFILEPGADVDDIRLAFDGIQGATIADSGELVLDLGAGQVVVFKAPVSWQDGTAGREAVASRYLLREDGSIGFEVGAYDPTRALTIDPVFLYGTYLGGGSGDQALGMTADSAGNVYVTGFTQSANFPTTAGAYGTSDLNGEDVFVTKLTPNLGGFVYSTYLGGNDNDDEGYNIAVDSSGNAYVTGYTKSNDFPLVSAYQTSLNGGWDAFVAKLNPAGNALVYSTYLGGSGGADTGYGIAVDAAGNAYVAGYATSASFPTTAGAADTVYALGEGFVTKLSAAGNTLMYSTYFGGSNFDAAYAIAVDTTGNAVIVGETQSNNLPVTANAFQSVLDGGNDILVAKLNAAGSAFTYATYLGGGGDDQGLGVTLGLGGKIYLTGFTGSNNFDVTAGALQPTDSGNGDAIVSVLDPSLSGAASLVYSTHLGGSKNNEDAWNISVDGAGRIYIAGSTDSDDFPTTAGAYSTTRAGGDDVFVVQINPAGAGASDLLYGSYWGGSNTDIALTGVYANGTFYFAGATDSNSSIATAGTVDTSYNGGTDGFVAAFSFATPPVVTVNATPLSYTENSSAQLLDPSFTVSDVDSATLTGATLQFTANYVTGEDSLAFNNSNPWGITGTWSAAGGVLTLTGASTVANYQLALRSITYTNVSQSPSTLTRSIRIVASDGVASSSPVVRQINVTSVNDVPAISAPAPQAMNEDGTLTFSSGGGNAIAVSDLDAGTNPVELVLSATNGVLTLFQTTGLSFTTGDGSSDASMTFTGTIANINAALNAMTFKPTADFSGAASVQVNMSDLGNTGTPGPQIANRSVAITVAAVNDAPNVSVPGGVLTYVENAGPIAVAPTASVTDVDSAQLSNAVMRITTGFVSGQDELTFTDPGGITGIWDSGSGTLTLTGLASPATYEVALRSVVYRNLSDDPSTALRTISFFVNDGSLDSAVATRDVQVDAVNDPPGIVAPALQVTNEDTPLVFSGVSGNQILLSDVDAGAGGIELSLDANDGVLVLAQTSGLTIVAGGDGTPFMTISGTLADVNAALNGLRFEPDADFAGAVNLALTLDDLGNSGSGASLLALHTVSIDVQGVNDAPAHLIPPVQTVAANAQLVFSLSNSNAIGVDDVDAGAGLLRVSVSVLNGSLSLGAVSGLVGLSGNGTSAITFEASLADLGAALDGLVFTPTIGFVGPTSLQLQTDDQGNSGAGGALITTSSVDIDVVYAAPTVTTTPGSMAYVENDPPAPIDSGLAIGAGTTGTLTQASVRITGNYLNGQDVLGFGAALPSGVSAIWDAPTGTLSFTGAATQAEYETLLRSVTYANTSDAPNAAPRTVTFTVEDGVSAVGATRQIAVTPVNDAPTVGAIADQSIPQGSSTGPIAFTVGDIETAAGSLVVTATSSNGTLLPSGNITLGGVGANRTISLAPLASQYGSSTITVSVSDGTDVTLLTFDLTVVPPNLPPVVGPTTLTVAENAANGTAVGTASATDPDPAKSFDKIYWTDYFNDRIVRANLDGSGQQVLVTVLLSDPVAIAVDYRGGKLYWTDTAGNEIWRSNLNGSGAQVFINSGLVTPTAIEVDSTGGTLYWTDAGNSTIQRVNLDGTGRVTLLSSANGLSAPTGIDLDVAGGKMYWVDDGTNRVQRANLDGSDIETLVTGLSQPGSIALDVANNKLYWSDPGTGRIGRANLDGTSPQASFISVSGGINELAVDTARGKIYWTEDDNDRIRRANLDGTGVTTVVSTGLLSDPSGIALGPSVPGLSYAITGGNTGGAFTINAATGAIAVANGAALNFEATPSYALTVQVTDAGGITGTGTVTVNLLNVNEAPAAVALAGGLVNEGTATSSGYAVGTLSTTDIDAGDTHTYAITGGTDAAKFSIAGNQLMLTDGVLDFETKPSYQVTVRSADAGGLTASQTFTVSVVNLPDAPTVTAVADQTVDEDAGGVTVAFTIGDQDTAIGSLTVTASSGNAAIVPTGNLVLAGAGANRTLTVTPAANAYGALTITLSVSDGTSSSLETFTLTVNPVADHLLVVDTVSDAADGDTSSIDALLVSRGADGFISLREAIVAANNSANAGLPDRIHFNIAGAGPHPIDVLSALPTVVDALIIDATTEPGYAGAPLIELNGAAAGAGVHGLHLSAGGSTLRGLVINRFDGAGILVDGGGSNLIAGNYVGLDVSGSADLGNAQYGIWVASSGNTIGGTLAGDRNVVSGNDIDGILIDGASGNVVQGNFVGTNAAGTGAVGNTEDGIWLSNASNNVIGGTTAAARNVLSGNNWSGIGINGVGSGNVIRGNYIGVDASGATGLANQINGVDISGADGTQIGGTGGAENVIAFNLGDGVSITGGTGHSVLENVIYANVGLGIDIDNDGVTTNDPGDGDTGTNLRMNFPVIYSVVVSGATVTVTGEARPGVTVRLFEAALDPSGHGEGQTFIGSGVVSGATPGSVDATARRFLFSFAAGTMNVGDRLTATATDAGGNTSEFALAVAASAASPGIIVTPTSGLVTDEDGGSASFTVMLATAPLFDVTIGVSSSDTSEGTVSLSSLTFTSATWNLAQTVVVTGVPDALADGSIAYSVVLSAVTSLDLGYVGIDPPDVSLVNLEGANDAPVITSDGGGATATRSVTENSTFVTDVDAVDIDLPAQVLTYSIFDGVDAGRFSIDAATGLLSFLAAPDREAPTDAGLDNVYEVRVQVSDGNGGFGLQALSVTVLDADEFDVGMPVDANAGANSVAENAAPGTLVGITAFATDADATTNTIAYSLDDSAGGRFAINAATGVVSVAGALDAETAVSHSIIVRAVSTDGSASTQSFFIAVTDVNDWGVGPVGDNDPAFDVVNENLAVGALVGYTALALDPDLTNNAVTYSLLDDAGGRFAINAATGVVTTAAVLDHEAGASHTIIVRAASSDGSSGAAAVNIVVGDVNEAPVVNNQSFAVDEDSAAGTAVGSVAASDPDVGEVLSYSILAGNTGGAFAVDAAGQITVANSAALDFETVPVFSLSIAVVDAGGLSDAATLTINLNNVNDPPVAGDDAGATSEDAPLNVAVAVGVLANDSDLEGGALTVTAVEGNPADVGNTIMLASGALVRLNADGSYNYDPNGAFDWLTAGDTVLDSFSYEVSDPGGATSSATVTITLNGVNDAPIGFDSVVTADEDTPYVLNSADFGFADPDGSLQALTIVSLPAQGSLTLSGAPVAVGAVVSEAQISAGDLVFLGAPNQNGASYASFVVRVSDGMVSAAGTSSVTFDVAPVNDLPAVAANAIAGSEDTVLNLTAAHFTGVFSDIEGDSLVQVEVVSLPGNGSLMLSGTPVAISAVIPVAQLGNLAFVPAADWNGSTLFAWKGHDGTGYSAAATNMTLTLAPVNDAPVLTAGSAGGSVLWGGTLMLAPGVLQADDVDNLPAQVVYTITALPGAGTLSRAGVALAVNGTFTQDDIAAGLVGYTHVGGTSSTDSFAFTVTDGAGGSIGATAFDIAVGAPPVLPPVVTPPPPPPPPPPTGGGSTPPASGGGGSGSSGGSSGTPADAPVPVDAPVGQTLEAALLGAPAPQLSDTASATRHSADARAYRVQFAQVLVDRSVAGYTINTNTLGSLVGTTATGEAFEPLSVGSTLLSGPDTTRVELLSAIESVTRNLSDTEFVGELDTMREQLDGKIEVQGQLVASSVAVTGGLSVGYVIWLLRGGLLLSSLLSSLPAWHAVDPMPVLARGGKDDDDEGADEDPLERLFGKAKDRLLGGWRGKGAAAEAETASAEATEGEAAAAKNATVEVPA